MHGSHFSAHKFNDYYYVCFKIPVFAYQMLAALATASLVPKFLPSILSIYPHCTLFDTFTKLVIARGTNRKSRIKIDEKKINEENKNKFTNRFLAGQNVFSYKDGIGEGMVTMLCVAIAAFIILLVIEHGVIRMIKQVIFPHIQRRYPNDDSVVDDDVLREKERIDRMSQNELKAETLAMQNVSKFYGSLCAVNKTSIALKR